ncbi:hypothetical protein N7462_006097 [Penicillium macrosclerotiorum]|uniref:uncharacterized protein n=1 Tax=Penicillium macrosclerotiorum TaxID=303699 RepID=UPI0025490373|nr:uncharacterized protein N7462_006097 [Penicillium macrosclerotiorum]KAJ5682932.1 hypothetical protein N7462_006097 [Penicillium macrosclerotiorum]
METYPTAEVSESSPISKRKPRTCQYCQRHFRRYEHLQRHIRIHTNEKPYKCSCGASFGRRDLLKRHQSIGHAPATTTQQTLPVTGFDNRSVQIQSNSLHGGSNESLWGTPDLQNASCGLVDRQRRSVGYQPQGTATAEMRPNAIL